jgi:hypothetical protein
LLSVLSNGELPLAVKVNDLSIIYRTTFERRPTLKQALVRFGRGQRAVREVEAIKNISFEVRTGTALGIIGSNGAGKSTLMRAMAGILPPTSGSIEVWGRASTLLALGVGFNKNLSGRENIILGGLAAGLSRREVEERADEVAEWTELGDFIDMPMRTYSSGEPWTRQHQGDVQRSDLARQGQAHDAWRTRKSRERLYEVRQGQEARERHGGYVAPGPGESESPHCRSRHRCTYVRLCEAA